MSILLNFQFKYYIFIVCAVEPQYNEPPYDEDPNITNHMFQHSKSKMYMQKKKDPNITNPDFKEHILLVPWHFCISGYHCNYLS